ncbi:Lrp/AsnC family transcriptional regulator [Cupriavidus gilardii]|nr:Lrp/AsnC family transcriptional regulator [Cupriavidus gilardii]MBO4123443.1 Lrp/AsnC family transcriptional regulator [Cupriavidus gilardii]
MADPANSTTSPAAAPTTGSAARPGSRLVPRLDETDRRILRALRRDGRLSNLKLAEQVGLSPTPCWNRVRALEEAGVIQGYTALLNQKALGLPDTVLIEVTLERHDDDMLDRFGRALAQLPEVMEAYLLTGEYDYLIKVAVAGTEGYEEFLRHKLYKLPGLRHSRSTFVLRCMKREPSVEP